MPEDDIPNKLRSAEEVARRTLVLHCVLSAAHGVSKGDLKHWLNEQNLWPALSPAEKSFLQSEFHDQKTIANITWQVEAQVPLFWPLKKIDRMNDMTALCDMGPVIAAIPALFSSTHDYISSACLRGENEIHEEYERVYKLHWEVRNAQRRDGLPTYQGINPGVIQERHYGFNWLIGYCNQEWDEISTDT